MMKMATKNKTQSKKYIYILHIIIQKSDNDLKPEIINLPLHASHNQISI